MTMVRNITSHSQRAVLFESGEISNRLSSEASRAAYLMNIFASDPHSTSDNGKAMPGLVGTAERFAKRYTKTISTLPNRASQNYHNLISLDVFVQALDLNEGNADQNAALASRLRSAIRSAAEGSGSEDEYKKLARELDNVANRLAAYSRQLSIAKMSA